MNVFAPESVSVPEDIVVVVDIGGGSMEVTLGAAAEIHLARSFQLGVLGLTDLFVSSDPLSKGDERKLTKQIRKQFGGFARQIATAGFNRVVATSGTSLSANGASVVSENLPPRRPILTLDDLARPLIGVATTWIETMPCNLNQRRLAEKVKEGIRAAGGTPMEFNTISISDGVSMGTEGMKASLISREVVADSVELVARSC